MKIYHVIFLLTVVFGLAYGVFKNHTIFAENCDRNGGSLIYIDGKYRCFSEQCVIK